MKIRKLLFCLGIALLVIDIPLLFFAGRAVWNVNRMYREADLRVVKAEVSPPTESGIRFVNLGFSTVNEPSSLIPAQIVAQNQGETDVLVKKYRLGTVHRVGIATSGGQTAGILPESRYEKAFPTRMLGGSFALGLVALVTIVMGRKSPRVSQAG